jgi:hypothetical protein
VGEEAFLEAGDEHDGELEALRRVHRHQPHLRLRRALLLVRFGQERQAIDEPAERGAVLTLLVLARGRHQLLQVLQALARLLGSLVTQVLEVAAAIQHLFDGARDRLLRDRGRERDHQIVEGLERAVRTRRQPPLGEHELRSRPQRATRVRFIETGGHQRRRVERRRQVGLLERVHHHLADAARRRVHDATKAHIVVRVGDQLQVGERVLDLLALVEADTADDAIGQAFAGERVFDRPRLGVDAVEDGGRGVVVLADGGANGADDEVRLFELVTGAAIDDLLAAGAIGPEPLVLALAVLPDHRRRRIENHLRRAIVALEAHHLCVGEVALEVEDVVEIGAAPFVDRLIRVADHREVLVLGGEVTHEQVLRPVGVLVFVDHHEAESSGVALARRRRLLEELNRLEQQVVEVERAALREDLQVALVDLRNLFLAKAPGLLLHLRRRLHAVLRLADAGERGTRRQQFFVDVDVAQHLLDRRVLIRRVVDDEIALEPDLSRLAAQQARAHRVERRDPHPPAVGGEQPRDARAHLLRGLVREGDREHFLLAREAATDEIGNAKRDDARLARARTGEDEQRPFDLLDGLALLRVQIRQKVHGKFETGSHHRGNAGRVLSQYSRSIVAETATRR